MNELERLGRPGAYRLGDLRAPGPVPAPPKPFRPSFSRAGRRGPAGAWILAFAAGTAAVAAGVIAGLFIAAFGVGVLAGLVARWGRWRPRVILTAAAAMAVIGWGIPLAWQALRAGPSAEPGRVIGWGIPLAWQALGAGPSGAAGRVVPGGLGVAGLPVHGTRGIEVALLAGAVQALAGVWLGRVIAAHWATRSQVRASDAHTDRGDETGQPVRLIGGNAGR